MPILVVFHRCEVTKSNNFCIGPENDPFLTFGRVKQATKSKNECCLWLESSFIPMESKKMDFGIRTYHQIHHQNEFEIVM